MLKHFKFIFDFSFSACWSPDTHERPSFKHILKTLDDIARSKFQEMPGDNFYSLQDDWKVEIEQMLEEIRFREQVCTFKSFQKFPNVNKIFTNLFKTSEKRNVA